MAIRALLDYLPLLACLVLAAVIDVRQRRIPNWLTFGLIVAGLARSAAVGGSPATAHALGGLLAGASAPFILFVLGAVGGGDVKLMAAVGTWLGARQALDVFVVQCLIGLALVLIQAAGQRRTLALFRNSVVLAVGMAHHGVASGAGPGAGKSFSSIDRPFPFAVPVALATLLVLLAGPWAG